MAFSWAEITDAGDRNNVQLADNAALTLPDSDWTIYARVKLDDNAGTAFQYFYSWGFFNAPPSVNLYFSEVTDILHAHIRSDNGATLNSGGGDLQTPDTPGTRTDWMDIIVERDSGVFTLYVDNVLKDSVTNASFNGLNVSGNLHFGARSDDDANRRLGGAMAECAKWDVALSAGQRAGLLKGDSPKRYPVGLKWHVPMIRELQELRAGIAVTQVDMTVVSHPRVIMPTPAQTAFIAAVAPPAGRIMGSLAGMGGLAGHGGIAGKGGGLAA